MKQLPPLPPPRPRWKRADVFLLLLAVLVVLSALRLYGGSGGAVSSPVVPCEESAESAAPATGISRREVEEMSRSGPPIRFLMLNTENYFVPGEKQRSRYVNHPKPEKEREAVADVIASAEPEVVGLIEMGGPVALADLQQRLAERGLNYPYSRVLVRGGEDRALALLSVFPIAGDDSCAHYGLFGQQARKMLRGILDVTLRLNDGRLFCFLGVHLKSRLGDEYAAAALRYREAQTVSQYIQQKMKGLPNLPMLVFGDLNDNPKDASIRLLEQGTAAPAALRRLNPKDSRGEEWTLYFRRGNSYNTFDHIFLNAPMKRRLKRGAACGVVDIPAARTASDHRALWCELR